MWRGPGGPRALGGAPRATLSPEPQSPRGARGGREVRGAPVTWGAVRRSTRGRRGAGAGPPGAGRGRPPGAGRRRAGGPRASGHVALGASVRDFRPCKLVPSRLAGRVRSARRRGLEAPGGGGFKLLARRRASDGGWHLGARASQDLRVWRAGGRGGALAEGGWLGLRAPRLEKPASVMSRVPVCRRRGVTSCYVVPARRLRARAGACLAARRGRAGTPPRGSSES